jgi:putative ABC transport system permease protein
VILVALRGLAGRKFRAIATALAIVLGVAMVSGTFVLTDTIDKAFSTIFEESYAGTDAIVSSKAADISFQGDTAEVEPVPESLLQTVRGVDGVDAATGSIFDEQATKIVDRNGKAIDTGGAPSFGFGIDSSPELARFNPLNLLDGRWARGPGEVVIDSGTADDEGFEVGDTVKIATLEPVRSFRVVGIAQYGSLESLGTVTFAVFDIPTAQQLLHREGKVDAISVAARDGVTPEELVGDLRQALPANFEAKTGLEQAGEDSEEITEFTSFIRYFLLAFGGIALFVGAFVIFNTLSITVAQRTREFATLRTIGASRRQLLGSVIVEALVIGILASVLGLLFGFALARGINALFVALELDLPTTSQVYAPRTFIASIVIGVLVTLVAGIFPAIRATRVPPIAAVREGATLPRGRLAPFAPYVAGVIVVLSLGLLGYAMFADSLDTGPRLLSIAAGILGLFVGVAMLSRLAVPIVATVTAPLANWLLPLLLILLYPITLGYWLLRYAAFGSGGGFERRAPALIGGLLLGTPIAWLLVLVMWIRSLVTGWRPEWPIDFPNVEIRSPRAAVRYLIYPFAMVIWLVRRATFDRDAAPPNDGLDSQVNSLGTQNSRRNPGRTAATAAALMIGLALVTFIAVLSAGMKKSNRDAIESQVVADYVVTSQNGFEPFVAAAGDAASGSTVSQQATSVRSDLAKVAGKSRYLTGIEPGAITSAYRFDWKEGSDDVLSELGSDGAIVDKDFADDANLAIGSRFSLLVPSGERRELIVRGIYEPPPFYPLLGSVSISRSTFDTLYERPRNQFTFVNVSGDPTSATQRGLERALADFPDAKVQTRDAWVTQQDEDFNQFLIMLYVLLALSVIVSLFGMVNTLVLSVFERTRELGMLRAVGMTRRQVRRMIRHESVITALIGAALGLPLGIFLAALVTRALSQFDVQFSLPGRQLVVFVVVALVAGVLAAIVPARRAARLRVLEALQYE